MTLSFSNSNEALLAVNTSLKLLQSSVSSTIMAFMCLPVCRSVYRLPVCLPPLNTWLLSIFSPQPAINTPLPSLNTQLLISFSPQLAKSSPYWNSNDVFSLFLSAAVCSRPPSPPEVVFSVCLLCVTVLRVPTVGCCSLKHRNKQQQQYTDESWQLKLRPH